ncbi:DUF6887 family protein [Nostoc sp. 'Lobaria pulmonaria (5183) cyanobiont']|uniref:DUF6887 family protein n=1 Tax=Nostoc sp. 'Lobaria pulmonaria (5183) cyanobiont' TaxID=1618022 RepID=UPI000CF3172F|nr:hypothetical protein [Nostoc sp. 'Lobaria pulmonaria (5183) cyanobiont']AVH73027.1 hypothetical protein NLP_4630 [Nostoc sp. 'Lobaria pulmonaria (5183) cyanobiont']
MTKANFQGMTKQELRAYVLEHRDDREAFYALTDKLREEPGIEITSTEQMYELIEAKLDEADARDAYKVLEEIAGLGTTPFKDIKRELGI